VYHKITKKQAEIGIFRIFSQFIGKILSGSISQFSSTFLIRGAAGTLSGKNKPGG
jgi:hypothetical protein